MTFTFIDLFAGIGGLHLPFQELGGECVFSSECKAKTPASALPDFDLLLAEFPCQPKLQKDFANTKGTLFPQIERILREKRPKVFLLENVEELTSYERCKNFITILNCLEDIDYHVSYKIFSVKDSSLPQNIYVVGLDRKQCPLPELYAFPFPYHPHRLKRLVDIQRDIAKEIVFNRLVSNDLQSKD